MLLFRYDNRARRAQLHRSQPNQSGKVGCWLSVPPKFRSHAILYFSFMPQIKQQTRLLSCQHVLYILHLQNLSSISLTADDDRLNSDSFHVPHSPVRTVLEYFPIIESICVFL